MSPTDLTSGIVQKVDRPLPSLVVLTVRLHGRTARIGVLGDTIGAAVGELSRALPRPRTPDAQTMRMRKELEGSRVVSLRHRPDREWARLSLLRAGETRALVATRAGVSLVLSEAPAAEIEPSVEDATPLLDAMVERLLSAAFEARKSALTRAIDLARKRAARRVEAVTADLARMELADEWIATANLLLHAASTGRGAREVSVVDWSSGEAVERLVALDPARTPKEEAEVLFRRARRMKRGRSVALARLQESRRGHDVLVALRTEVAASALDEASLEACERRAAALGVKSKGPMSAGTGAGRARAPEARRPYRAFTSGDRAIWVGRGAEDNDALTLHVARPHHVWLHAKGRKGAHVVVPLDKGAACPSDLLIDAAHLAAHFSDARGEQAVEVAWAERRHVRKPRGSAPGAVTVDREKVIVLRIEPARLQRLLATVAE